MNEPIGTAELNKSQKFVRILPVLLSSLLTDDLLRRVQLVDDVVDVIRMKVD